MADDFVPVKKVGGPPSQDFQPIARVNPNIAKPLKDKGLTISKIYEMVGQPLLEGFGMVGGGIVGSGVGPAGTVGGAALGYAAAKKVGEIGKRTIDLLEGEYTPGIGVGKEIEKSIQDIKTGTMMEMGGQVGGKLLMKGASGLGKLGKQAIGKLTGAGEGATAKAVESGVLNTAKNPLKSATNFDRAMRGEMSGQEVVELAQTELGKIKNVRQSQYQASLKKIQDMGQNVPTIPGQPAPQVKQIDPTPIRDELTKLADRYRIGLKINSTGEVMIDTSQAAMGKSGRADIKEVIQEIGEWKDFSPLGLDALKRRVADFYSDSSAARQFVISIKNTIHDTIAKDVPEYAKMTKNYEKLSTLIKDIESNLMMRKSGMSGRIVSDQTLRRISSAMKENFELRRELVDALSKQGEDVTGAVAGYTMKNFTPRGLSGTGMAIVGSTAAALLKPELLPLVAMSSPRVAGEFLRLFGKYAVGKGMAVPAGRAIGYEALRDKNEEFNLPVFSQQKPISRRLLIQQ